MSEIERYLATVGSRLPRRKRAVLVSQLRTEINEMLLDARTAGRPEPDAIIETLTQLGPPDSLGRHLAAVYVWRAPRPVEIAMALVGLLAGLPLFVVSAILVKVDSNGPLFYAFEWRRSDGRVVRRYKLRTMVHQPPVGTPRRVTRVGRLLRSTALDEWPQLINLLRGDLRLGELLQPGGTS
jgi:Bacterial sugar transferase